MTEKAMQKKFIYYVLLFTGILVIIVGLQNLINHWGSGEIAGIFGQVLGFLCLLGGAVNFWVANDVKKHMPKKEGSGTAN